VTRPPGACQLSCATLTYLAEPADPALGSLLQILSPGQVLASIRSGTIPARATRAMYQAQAAGSRPALARGGHNCPACPQTPCWHDTQLADPAYVPANQTGLRTR
jgi:hypothetical protein